MHLLSFRVIGHPDLPDSSWLEVGSGLTILKTRQSGQAEALLRALQAINPPYDPRRRDPFADFSAYTSAMHHTRRVVPAKKTAALAIFAASPRMVEELAAIAPVLYETDRIELGRRRDYSRWMNFIELSASSRWSEIEPLISSMLSCVGPEAARAVEPLQTTMASLRATDRIKDEVAVQLREQLQRLRDYLPAACLAKMDRSCQAINRADHFHLAKKAVAARLPFFLALSATTATPGPDMEAASELLSWLTGRLRHGHADQTAFEDRLHQVNRDLHPLHPELNLRFRVQGDQILLESIQDAIPLSVIQLSPVERLKALLAGLAALHVALIDCQPIFLLDLQGLQLPRQQQVDLLDALHQCAAHRQCLVIPDNTFLPLCIAEAAPTEPTTITLLELR
jgi:hypothetical protein